MTRFRPLVLGVSLAALSTAAMAQTAADRDAEITALRAQVERLAQRLEALESAPAQPVAAAPPPILTIPVAAPTAPGIAAVDWSTGLPELKSPDGAFSFKPRVRVTTDLATTTGSRFDNRNITGAELRGVRLGAQGRIAGGFNYWVEADFADNAVNVNNAFLSWSRKYGDRELAISVGQRLNDRGVEGSAPEDQTPFLERSLTVSTLGPERGSYGVGVTSRLSAPDWHASLSVTGDAISDGVRNDSVSVMARAHRTVLKSDDGFVHLGGWAFLEDIAAGTAALSRNSVVAARFNDNLRLSTGPYVAPRGSSGFGLEAGGVRGPAWIMAEGGRRTIETAARDYDQDALALSAGFFLTGESPPLSTRTGTWARPDVSKPFGSTGYGALEIVGRYDQADYSDSPTGGQGDVWLVGANWYPTRNTRVSLHWSRWSIDNASGAWVGEDEGDSLTARVQAAF